MKKFLIVSCLVVCLYGCGGGSGNTMMPPPQIQDISGQWSFIATDTASNTTAVFANFTWQGGGNFFATGTNTAVCDLATSQCQVTQNTPSINATVSSSSQITVSLSNGRDDGGDGHNRGCLRHPGIIYDVRQLDSVGRRIRHVDRIQVEFTQRTLYRVRQFDGSSITRSYWRERHTYAGQQLQSHGKRNPDQFGLLHGPQLHRPYGWRRVLFEQYSIVGSSSQFRHCLWH